MEGIYFDDSQYDSYIQFDNSGNMFVPDSVVVDDEEMIGDDERAISDEIVEDTYEKEEKESLIEDVGGQEESSRFNLREEESMGGQAVSENRLISRAIDVSNNVNELECLANYIAELSLLEYSMLSYAPSLIAASAIFLPKYILFPSKRPWNSTLQHYTLYRPSDLCKCAKELHCLCCSGHTSTLPAIREKYSQHKYKFVAKKYCPPSMPQEFFQNQSY